MFCGSFAKIYTPVDSVGHDALSYYHEIGALWIVQRQINFSAIPVGI